MTHLQLTVPAIFLTRLTDRLFREGIEFHYDEKLDLLTVRGTYHEWHRLLGR